MKNGTISSMENEIDNTQYLKSPLSDRQNWLQPMTAVNLQPYFGSRRKLKLFRTRYSLGSDSKADISVEDPFVSPVHARIVLSEEGQYYIEDQGSKNGVYLNGLRVQRAPLPKNGNLRIGRSVISWREELQPQEGLAGDWIFSDPQMLAILEKLRAVAKSNLPVLLLGETGTGKEIFAQLIHQWSKRENGPFVVVNGALTGGSLSESELFGHKKGSFTGSDSTRVGALRTANGGTFFLDEVADIPAAAQVKLLRSLECGEVKAVGSDQVEHSDFRLITATSQSLEKKIEEGAFRLDLYYRIAGQVIRIPPLRERAGDALAIAEFIAKKKGCELDKEVEGKILSYSWPGNVRELRAVMERAVILAMAEGGARIQSQHLGDMGMLHMPMNSETEEALTLEQLERNWIQRSLERNGWSRLVCAKELGIARSTLFEKMRRYGIRDRL